jgi:hypothetical protein
VKAVLQRAAAAAGLQVEPVGPDAFVLTGPVRPYWALAAAGLLALPTLGLSLLLLRIRRPGSATVTVSEGDDGPLVWMTGRLPDYFPWVVEDLLGEHRPLLEVDADQSPAAEPWVSERPTAQIVVAQKPAPQDAAARVTGDGDATVTTARQPRIDLTSGGPRLRFDDGTALTVTRFSLIGRAPVPERGDPPAQLVPFADSGLSVSKTHLSVGVDARGLWICDRQSTNGTAITDETGTRTACVPGQRYGVAPGSTVHIGDRSFSVPYSDVAAGRSQ